MSEENANKPVGPDFAYTDALNQLMADAAQKSHDDGTAYQKMPLRPSSAGKCERELAFELNEYRGNARYEREVPSPDLQRIFSLGHSVEYALIKDLRQHFKDHFEIRYQQQSLSFMFLESKVDSKFSTWIEGSTDLVLWSKDHKGIADVKSKKEKFSNYRQSDWEETAEKWLALPSVKRLGDTGFYVDDVEAFLDEVNDPFLAMNVLQINLYACNKFLAERQIDHASLFYYSKNTSRLKELRFRPSQGLHDYVLQKFKNAFEAVEEGDPMLARQEFNLGSIKCAFCPFNKYCWSESDPKKAWFKSLPSKRWATDTDRISSSEGKAVGRELEALYEEYAAAQQATAKLKNLEAKMCEILSDAEVDKVRFSDGEIYEMKLFKSGGEHLELRRSKVR